MKTIALSTVAAASLFAALAVPASALPSIPKAPGVESTVLIPIAEGCGRGWFRNMRGRCVPGWRR